MSDITLAFGVPSERNTEPKFAFTSPARLSLGWWHQILEFVRLVTQATGACKTELILARGADLVEGAFPSIVADDVFDGRMMRFSP
jgi:hypothetical protein